jgi:type I restriction enzyme M protein
MKATLTADHFTHLDQFGADLWKLADALRANSGLASNEYFMPILGLLFLRHASNRYYAAKKAIAEDQAAGRMPKRPLRDADFTQRLAMNLPKTARYDVILGQPMDGILGHALSAEDKERVAANVYQHVWQQALRGDAAGSTASPGIG